MSKLPEKLNFTSDYNPPLKLMEESINQLIDYLQEKEKPEPEEKIEIGDEVEIKYASRKGEVISIRNIARVRNEYGESEFSLCDLKIIRKRP